MSSNPSTNDPVSNAPPGEPLYSEYASDPDMADLVEMFVSEMPDRIQSIQKAAQDADLNALAKLSHQLKGAAGGYGFTPITEAAAEVEKQVKAEKQLEDIERSLSQLLTLCRRATSDPH